jgi:hypothetical protein
VRRRLTRTSDGTAWRTWRKGPVVVVDNVVWINRGTIIARGDVVIRPWAVRFVGCTWQRLKSGERIGFPCRSGTDGPIPVISFENKEVERRFSRAALAAFRSAAAKKKPAGMPADRLSSLPQEASQPL